MQMVTKTDNVIIEVE